MNGEILIWIFIIFLVIGSWFYSIKVIMKNFKITKFKSPGKKIDFKSNAVSG